ncbi:hypothetical protein O6H91_02G035500 [Diphasiastrum complanatum]|uniref:Uncharacterized protein n=1 Tax=Diphasiastrum complanatum TaxID=34168 RepID=A0ACC2EEC3_DIPCM|nr:hypothetical protein O6H91_02G035500 [Diphasiastrum complanatum]
MKGRGRVRASVACGQKLSLPVVLISCFFFFVAGYYIASSLTEDPLDDLKVTRIPRPKLIQNESDAEFVALDHGKSGDNSVQIIPFQVLSWRPRILLFPNFANAEQCRAIVALAKSHLTPSSLALRKGETMETTMNIRTSSGTFLSASQDKTGTLAWVEEKMARATMVPRTHGEAFNVLRYELGQKYNCHYDYFDPIEYGPQKSQRMASFLLYLSDVEEGGETMFPYEDYKNMNVHYDFKQCIGLKVKPRQGDALLFYSMFPNGTFDRTSLHGSCPVLKGEKWVATKWIRNREDW